MRYLYNILIIFLNGRSAPEDMSSCKINIFMNGKVIPLVLATNNSMI